MTVKLTPPPDHLTFKAYRKVHTPRTAGMEAETAYTIRYTILKFPRRGDKVGLNLLLTVDFVEAESWVLRSSQNEARLLDHERLHPTQHEAELLVHVAVQRDGRVRLELDHVEHRACPEERASGDAVREHERSYLVESDEYGLHQHDSTPPHGRQIRPAA